LPSAASAQIEETELNLDFTEEQHALREAVRRMLLHECSTKIVRQMENDPVGYPQKLWSALTAIGLPGLTLSETAGGLGQDTVALAIVYEEFGRALCPSPHLESSVIAAGLIERSGSREQKQKWLPTIATGRAPLTVALLEPGNDYHPLGIQTKARKEGPVYRVSGTKYCVTFAAASQQFLTFVRTGTGEKDVDILLVDPKTPGITLRQTQTLAADAQYVVEFNEVLISVSDRLGAAHSAWSHWQDLLPDIWIATAAWAIGCADHALEMATAYAKERVQFDRPIGSFQAVAHPLTTVAMEIEGARALVYQAAWARANGHPAAQLAAMAKLQGDFANRHATAVGHQTLGGIGFTLDIDMQLYHRRAKQNQLSWGDPEFLETTIADGVLAGSSHGL
jgi:alkylation response protein AidB-like acyl-CoA dehydrogenase